MKLMFTYIFILLTTLVSHGKVLNFSGDHVKGEIHIPYEQVSLNSTFTIGIAWTMDPEWHIYWINPGDSGAEPKITTELNSQGQESGLQISKIYWPAPKRILLKDFTNFGYENKIYFPVDVKITKESSEYPIKIEWLVCKIECIPGFADLKLSFKIGDRNISTKDNLNDIKNAAIKSLPQPMSEQLQYSFDNTSLIFYIPTQLFTVSELTDLKNNLNQIDAFFTTPSITHNHNKPTFSLSDSQEQIIVRMQLDQNFDFTGFKKFDANAELLIKASHKSYIFSIAPEKHKGSSFMTNSSIQTTSASTVDMLGFFTSLFFAFLGGIILNLMPCVFPVLSIKILSFVDEKPSQLKASGWMYTLGVLVSFAILALTLLILRSLGESYGWGFQMQSPIFISLMALLFFLLGLNFYGTLEFGDSFIQASGVMNGQKNKLAAFVTGVLAVVVATPCTAPFMGSALGASLFLPSHLSFLIFLSLGFGLAFPFLVLSYAPHLLKKLPRPGRWMEILKQLFAFPMFLTSLWLLWILEQQTSFETILILLSLALTYAFLIWWPWKLMSWHVRLAIAAGLTAFFIYHIQKVQLKAATQTQVTDQDSLWQDFTPEKVESAMQSGQAVFIDFTAKWCITCQVNKRTVLRTEKIESLFKSQNVLLLSADWTKQNPIITKTLESFGRRSVPLYVYYPANDKAKPILLPEILTQEMIEQLFKK